MRNVKTLTPIVSLAAAVLASASAQAQMSIVGPRPQPTYGTSSQTIYTVNAWDLDPASNAVEMGITSPGLRYISSSPGATATLYGGAQLPAGAVLEGINLFGCDDDIVNDITVGLYACADPAGACTLLGEATTTGVLGCISSSGILAGTVDNDQTYFVQVNMGQGIDNRLRSLKIVYRLQVSPDPAIESFPDVPIGHPFHRFVEALYAAGITAGYPDGRFGVDDSITRGQMAVFLSIALGLHWPN